MTAATPTGATNGRQSRSHLLDLAAMLAPVEVEPFLRTCWGQNFEHVPGKPGKFSALLPWPALNEILEQHRLEPPRLRLTREGQPVPVASFITHQTNRRRSGQPIPRLRAADLTGELRSGATLVLDAVDELQPPVRLLAEALERVFRVRIQVNAYAGFRTSHGFDLHWDEHDVFVLQVAGRKRWKVYGMTRKYPLSRDAAPNLDAPSNPLWEGLLEEGDLLYIPRGWWHVATPLDEPTLHLTVGVSNPTGADLLSWYIDRLRAHEDVRRDLPVFADADGRRQFMDALGQLLAREWRPEILAEYLRETDSMAQPRPSLSLPWAASADPTPPEWVAVKWNVPRSVPLERNGASGEIALSAAGRRWRFAESAGPMLNLLAAGDTCSVSDLYAAAAGPVERDTVRKFVGELLSAGLVSLA